MNGPDAVPDMTPNDVMAEMFPGCPNCGTTMKRTDNETQTCPSCGEQRTLDELI